MDCSLNTLGLVFHFYGMWLLPLCIQSEVAHVFLCFMSWSATCNFFQFWLVHWVVCVLCDWPKWLLWFWSSDTVIHFHVYVCMCFKPRANDPNISMQHIATLLDATCCMRLATLLQHVVTCWMLLAQFWIFHATFVDVIWCCSRLARFVQQQCCPSACALVRFLTGNILQHGGQQ